MSAATKVPPRSPKPDQQRLAFSPFLSFQRGRVPRRKLARGQLLALCSVLASAAIIAGLVLLQHHKNYSALSGPRARALNVRANLFNTPQDTQLLRFAKDVESALVVTAREVAKSLSTFPTIDSIEVTITKPDAIKRILVAGSVPFGLDSLADNVSLKVATTIPPLPIVSERELQAMSAEEGRAFAASGAWFPPFEILRVPDSSGTLGYVAGHYALPSILSALAASHGLDSTAILSDSTSLSFRETISRFAARYPTFPAAPDSNVSGAKHPGPPRDSTTIGPNKVAFFYAGLRLRSTNLAPALRPYVAADAPGFVYGTRAAVDTPPDTLSIADRYAYLGYPAAALGPGFVLTERPYFAKAAQLQPGEVSWTFRYEDIGTGLSVVTAFTPIVTPAGITLGFCAVDLLSDRVLRLREAGTPFLLNLGILLLLSLALMEILYATGSWDRFGHVLYAILGLYAYYAVRCVLWLTTPADGLFWSATTAVFDAGLSLLNNVFFLSAAVLVFDSLGRAEVRGFKPMGAWLERFQKAHPNIPMPVFGVVCGALVSIAGDVFTAYFRNQPLFGGDHDGPTFTEAMDYLVSFFALTFFGMRFSAWVRRHFNALVSSLAFAAFAAYGVAQLFTGWSAEFPEFWLIVLLLKTVALSGVVAMIYYWTEHQEYSTDVVREIQGNILAQTIASDAVLIVASADGHVRGLNRTALSWLNLEADTTVHSTNATATESEAAGAEWPGLVSPLSDMHLQELFGPGEFARIMQRVRAKRPDAHDRRVLEREEVHIKPYELDASLAITVRPVVLWSDLRVADPTAREELIVLYGEAATPHPAPGTQHDGE